MTGLARRAARGVLGRARARFASRAVVLLYHRVADVARDPWDLAVSPTRFDAHMATLARGGYELMSLGALVDALRAGALPRRAVAVTFDDGYADVVRAGLPLLERHGVPATVFAVSGALGSRREFWWDQLERLVLDAPILPAVLALTGAGGEAPVTVPTEARRRGVPNAGAAERGWRAWTSAHPTPRHALYHALWRRLQPADAAVRAAALDALAAQLDATPPDPAALPATHEELRTFDRSRVGTVGAHTVTHPSLAALPVPLQTEEILRSRRDLEALLGATVDLFAYPFGGRDAYTDATVAAVREAGFRAACVNQPAPVRPGVDPLRLPRLYVSDWDAAEFARRLEAIFRE